MGKTLFIASFPDLFNCDFSKTGIIIGDTSSSDYYFRSCDYVNDYIDNLVSKAGSVDIFFVPTNNKIIMELNKRGIKCIVLYPNIDCKEIFIEEMRKSGVEKSFVDSTAMGWDFIIKRLDKHNYDYKFVLGENDKIIDVLKLLLTKRDVLGYGNDILSLDEANVDRVLEDCLSDMGENADTNKIIEGISHNYLLNSQKVWENREIITGFVDEVLNLEMGISFNELKRCKDGRIWTNDIDYLEKLMVLGIANNNMIIPFSRDMDKMFIAEVPYVIKNKKRGEISYGK